MKGIEGSKLGRYELRCRVAQGGMSEVYLGYDHRVRRWVAVKVLYGSDEPFVRRFEREALAVGALSHEHILPLYDFGEQRPWYYLVMPYVEGGTLRDYLHKRGRLTLEEAGSFLEQIAAALQHAHDHGVIHRDVKPSNILLRPDGHAYLVDFGLARAKIEAGSFSRTGAMAGTPEYMAPEQSSGINDYRSDIYSLGIILYQMLIGHVPFTGDSPVAVSIKHLQTTPPAPRSLNTDISQAVEDVILKALAKNPDERYQEVTALATAYRHALGQELVARHGKEHLLTTEAEATKSALEGEKRPTHAVATAPFRKTQLFPLGYETSLLPIVSGAYRRRKRVRLQIIALCCLLIAISVIPLGRFWPLARSVQLHPPLSSLPTRTKTHQAATATALALMHVQATLAAEARVQASTGITSAIGGGNILYYDAMTSSGGGWIDDGKQCTFSPQGYRVSLSLPHALAWCYSNQQQFADVIITAQVRLLQGDFCGLVFRLNPYAKAFYVLELNSHEQYRFQRVSGSNPGAWLTLIDWTSSSAIQPGYGQTNVFLVVASKTHFRFYINQQLIVATITDGTYSTGLLGLLVGEDGSAGAVALFSHVGVFQAS